MPDPKFGEKIGTDLRPLGSEPPEALDEKAYRVTRERFNMELDELSKPSWRQCRLYCESTRLYCKEHGIKKGGPACKYHYYFESAVILGVNQDAYMNLLDAGRWHIFDRSKLPTIQEYLKKIPPPAPKPSTPKAPTAYQAPMQKAKPVVRLTADTIKGMPKQGIPDGEREGKKHGH
jgi:hypothetical protein